MATTEIEPELYQNADDPERKQQPTAPPPELIPGTAPDCGYPTSRDPETYRQKQTQQQNSHAQPGSGHY